VSPGASSQPRRAPQATTAPGAVPRLKGGAGDVLSNPILDTHSKFALCLAQQGIPLSAADRPRLSPRQQIAVRKCGATVPGGVGNGVLSAADKFRACMKRHGAPLPSANQPFAVPTEDVKIAAAVRACASLLPSTGGTT
jgi:hypothetical protein